MKSKINPKTKTKSITKSIEPLSSSKVIISDIIWHGWLKFVKPLIIGISKCLEKFNKTFSDLDSDKQISVMRMMEKNKLDKVKWKNSSLFFNKIRLHTMQGFYGSPIHGGNKNFLSFDILNINGLLRQRLESPKK